MRPQEYSLFFVPRRTLICEEILSHGGVYGALAIGQFDLDLIPIDDDVLSLELPLSFKQCFLEGDRSALYYVARSLMKLQSKFGQIPNIMGKGHCARSVADMMMRMGTQLGEEHFDGRAPEIDQIILIDRDVDLITPLCTQLTYEGLIDEYFQIQNGFVTLDAELLGVQQNPDQKRKKPLNSNDKLYAEYRDKNFAVLGPILSKKALYISEIYDERHQAQTVGQIKDFMKKLGELQQEHSSLRVHTNIAERISTFTRTQQFTSRLEAEQSLLAGPEDVTAYIEELINRQESLTKVLRIACLMSLTNNGIKGKYFDFLRREILQTYGYDKLFTLDNLERLGMLKRNESRSPWPSIRKALHLVVDDCNEAEPNDISYVYSGYAPLSVRLVQYAVQPGWKAIEDTLRQLPGPTFEEKQQRSSSAASQEQPQQGGQPKRSVTLVFFLGGVTFAEISAIRFLSQTEDGQRNYIVATTKLISGDSLVDSVQEQIDNRLQQ